DLITLIEKMQTVLKDRSGSGLTANQVGVNKRLFVYYQEDGSPSCMVNPEITEQEETQVNEESCLAFPGVYIGVTRSKMIRVKFQDAEGGEQEEVFEGYTAAIIQQQIDSLNGLF